MAEQGIDLNIKDGHGRTVLHYASSSNLTKETKFLLQYINSDIRDENGQTALHLAYQAWCKDCVNILLESGSDQEITDKSGKKAIDYQR